MNRLERGLASLGPNRKPAAGAPRDPPVENVVTAASVGLSPSYAGTDQTLAMKLSAVSRCIDILSDSIGKMPFYVYDVRTRQRVEHPVTELLSLRPNPWQTPFQMRKQVEAERICRGNGVAWIRRDRNTLRPLEIVPIPWGYWTSQLLPDDGSLLYFIEHPFTHEPITCGRMDVIDVMAFSRNGYRGIGYLERAEEVIRTGRAAQEYSASYYQNGGQPSGILRTDSDLGGTVKVKASDGTEREISKKDRIREEWERRHAGPTNAQRIAVLDMGLDYKPLSISNRDAQFVEQSDLSVADIGRFFGVPLYKLMAGKQSYSSNEQNAIEYVVGTLHPNAVIWEQELLYKLMAPQDIDRGLRIHGNLMGELRGDFQSRGAWYKDMRENGVLSVNEIRELEDMPAVDGGDEHYASLNYVPLSVWPKLSEERAGSGAGSEG